MASTSGLVSSYIDYYYFSNSLFIPLDDPNPSHQHLRLSSIYLGGASSGPFVYFFPCDAERVLRLDFRLFELELVGPSLLDGENKFQNGFAGRDGCLYGIPQRATGILRVEPGYLTGQTEDYVDILPIESMKDVKDKFEGGVMGGDGNIFCVPLRSEAAIKVVIP